MGEFDVLVDYIEEFDKVDLGKLDDMSGVHCNYPDDIRMFMDDVTRFALENPQYGLTRYKDIIEQYNDGEQKPFDEINVTNADAQFVLALLVSVVRSERVSTGVVYGYIENGAICRWLRRLKELNV